MFKLGLAQCCHPGDGDVVGMADAWMTRAKSAGVDLLVFPESFMTPYELAPGEFSAAAQPIDGPFCTEMNALAAKHGLWTVYTANERDTAEQATLPFNTAIVVDASGSVRASYRKVHLFDTDFTRESEKVASGSALPAPIDTPFGRVCVAICYDLRFPELARAAALAECDLLVYTSAWVDGPRKVDQWRTLLRARAIENELFVAGLSRCDRGFGIAKRDYAGHSCVFGPLCDELAAADLEEQLLVCDIEPADRTAARRAMPVLVHRRPDLYAKGL